NRGPQENSPLIDLLFRSSNLELEFTPASHRCAQVRDKSFHSTIGKFELASALSMKRDRQVFPGRFLKPYAIAGAKQAHLPPRRTAGGGGGSGPPAGKMWAVEFLDISFYIKGAVMVSRPSFSSFYFLKKWSPPRHCLTFAVCRI